MNFEYCNGMVYVVRKGDSLYSISRRYNIPLASILRANPYVDVYNLQVGDEICIPVRGDNTTVSPGPGPLPFPTPELPPSNDVTVSPGPGPLPFPTPELPPSNDVTVSPGPGPLPLPTPELPGPLPLPTPVIPVGTVVAYVIRDQDTIRDILNRFGIELEDLLNYNNLNGIMLKPGMTINIPMYPVRNS